MMKTKNKIKAYLCPHCNNPTSGRSKDICSGYFRACLLCDEDFYKWELEEVVRTLFHFRRMKRLIKRDKLMNA